MSQINVLRFSTKRNIINGEFFCGAAHCQVISFWTTLVRIVFASFWWFMAFSYLNKVSFWGDWAIVALCCLNVVLDSNILLCYIVCKDKRRITLNIVTFTWCAYLLGSIALVLSCSLWFISPNFFNINSETLLATLVKTLQRQEINGLASRSFIGSCIGFELIFTVFCLLGWYSSVIYRIYLKELAGSGVDPPLVEDPNSVEMQPIAVRQ